MATQTDLGGQRGVTGERSQALGLQTPHGHTNLGRFRRIHVLSRTANTCVYESVSFPPSTRRSRSGRWTFMLQPCHRYVQESICITCCFPAFSAHHLFQIV